MLTVYFAVEEGASRKVLSSEDVQDGQDIPKSSNRFTLLLRKERADVQTREARGSVQQGSMSISR